MFLVDNMSHVFWVHVITRKLALVLYSVSKHFAMVYLYAVYVNIDCIWTQEQIVSTRMQFFYIYGPALRLPQNVPFRDKWINITTSLPE